MWSLLSVHGRAFPLHLSLGHHLALLHHHLVLPKLLHLLRSPSHRISASSSASRLLTTLHLAIAHHGRGLFHVHSILHHGITKVHVSLHLRVDHKSLTFVGQSCLLLGWVNMRLFNETIMGAYLHMSQILLDRLASATTLCEIAVPELTPPVEQERTIRGCWHSGGG